MTEIYRHAYSIVDLLHQAGFVAYYAGGWVRDFLLNQASEDIDIATSATPETVQKLFPHTVPIGIAFGIVLVIIGKHQYEVATFREDLEYDSTRRPTRISFSTAQLDAKRRDFTINGMFYDPIKREILDYIGGKIDLKAGLIRAIGNPHKRIEEDRVRMVRAIRFASRFDFLVEAKTAEAIREHATELLPAIAIERVVQELYKSKAKGNLYKMLILLQEFGLLKVIFPDLVDMTLCELKMRIKPITTYPPLVPLIASLLALFPGYTCEQATVLCKGLKLANEELQFALYLHQMRMLFEEDLKNTRPIDPLEWIYLYANKLFLDSLAIIALHIENTLDRNDFLERHQDRSLILRPWVIRAQQKNPVLTSKHLKNAGITSGKKMGMLLKEAERIAVREGLEDPELVLARLQDTPLWHTS